MQGTESNLAVLSAFIALLLSPVSIAWSQTLYPVEKLLRESPVLEKGEIILDDEKKTRVDAKHLSTLLEVHRRIGEVAKSHVGIAIVVHDSANAAAVYSKGLIIFTTKMLNLIGHDPDMMAALMGHEYAHMALRHDFTDILNIPNSVRAATSIGREVALETRSVATGRRAANVAFVLFDRRFSREQETEADRVGAQYAAAADYSPDSMLRFMEAMLKAGEGNKTTSYLDTHPGWDQRITNIGTTVSNERFASIARALRGNKNWRSLSNLAAEWTSRFPDSGQAWYYYGIALRELKQVGALHSFAKAVRYEPSQIEGRLEFCIELYRNGQERESLVCAEYLPLNEMRDEFTNATFKHTVVIGGFAPQRYVSDSDASIIAAAIGRPDLMPKSQTEREREKRMAEKIARQQAAEQKWIDALRRQCENAKETPVGPRREQTIKLNCNPYENAVRRQHERALSALRNQ